MYFGTSPIQKVELYIETSKCVAKKEEWIITNNKTEMYIVRSLALANWLCGQGHPILKVEDSEKNPRFKVFLFEDTKNVRNSVTEYLNKKEV